MKRLFFAGLILIFSLKIGAQNTEMFYLNFFVKEFTETETESIMTAALVNTTVKYDPAWEGSVVAIKGNPEEIGKVKFTHIADGGNPMVEIRIPQTVDHASYLRSDGRGLLKILVNSPAIPAVKESLIYELYRLNISLESTLDNIPLNLLKGIKTYGEDKFSADDYFIRELVEESAFVAYAMKGNMESHMVEKGRYKGMDVFTAMENSHYWDVEHFLKYMIVNYRKYQGTDWKFSEIFATWIIDGAKGNDGLKTEQLKSKLRQKLAEDEFIGVKTYFESELLRGIDQQLLKELCQDYRADSEWCMEHGLDGAYGLLVTAENLAEYLEDEKEIAWCDFLHGEETDYNHDSSIEDYKKALAYFKETNDNLGLTKVYNGMGNRHNLLKTNSGYKKGLSFFKKALEQSEAFTGNEKGTDPIIALIYLGMGTSYLGLNNSDKAVAAFEKGLEYAYAEDVWGYKRKTSLETGIAKAFKEMGNAGKQKKYEGKAAASKKFYLAELQKREK